VSAEASLEVRSAGNRRIDGMGGGELACLDGGDRVAESGFGRRAKFVAEDWWGRSDY